MYFAELSQLHIAESFLIITTDHRQVQYRPLLDHALSKYRLAALGWGEEDETSCECQHTRQRPTSRGVTIRSQYHVHSDASTLYNRQMRQSK